MQVSKESASKMYLHCSKYPHFSVFGILLQDKENTICDSIPLFHGSFLAPMFEIAMKLIESRCNNTGESIAGCYYASELVNNEFTPFVLSVADKITSLYPNSVLLRIDNNQMHPLALQKLFQPFNKLNGTWKPTKSELYIDPACSSQLQKQIAEKQWETITDFDNHLADPSKTWL